MVQSLDISPRSVTTTYGDASKSLTVGKSEVASARVYFLPVGRANYPCAQRITTAPNELPVHPFSMTFIRFEGLYVDAHRGGGIIVSGYNHDDVTNHTLKQTYTYIYNTLVAIVQ